MLISKFARTTGLSVDTVRFYVRQGLLTPPPGGAGGSRPYLDFGAREVRIAAGIRTGRALGLSLADIKSFLTERRGTIPSRRRGIRLMETHRDQLAARLIELQGLLGYMDQKIAWMKGEGPEPGWPATPAA